MPEIKPGEEYSGTIVKGIDSSQKGMYFVHIPEFMSNMASDEGWPVKNHVHNWRITKSENGVYGQKLPLHPGTNVIIKFYQEDETSGYIDRIISDDDIKSDLMAPDFNSGSSPEDRDEQYILLATPRKKNIIYINEETSENPNTLYISFNEKRTLLKFDETGLQLYTEDDMTVESANTVNLTAASVVNIYSATSINMDSGAINLNSGLFGGKSVDKS